MKPLSRLQSLAFTLGGLLLLVGALLPMVPSLSDFAPYVFCAGALLFGTLQLVQRYEGRNVTVRRLRRQQMLGACLLMISACLLLVTAFRLLPLRGGEWKVALAIAAVLELYTAFRLPAELEKEEKGKEPPHKTLISFKQYHPTAPHPYNSSDRLYAVRGAVCITGCRWSRPTAPPFARRRTPHVPSATEKPFPAQHVCSPPQRAARRDSSAKNLARAPD